MNDLAYFLSVIVGIGSIFAGVILMWAIVEGGYFMFCKAKGKKY